MTRPAAALFAVLFFLAGTGSALARHTGLLPMGAVFVGRDRFEMRVRQLRPIAEKVRAMPIGERVAWFGQMLLGTPYKGFTLEIDDHIEAPSVNLAGLDCWTFFETALAFARMVEEPEEQWTPETLLRCIEMDRYWGGECDGTYLSRIHYLEDWLHDNARRGLVRDLTRSLGGINVTNSAIEMTHNWKKYRYMRNNPELRAGISELESRLRRQSLVMIPKSHVAAIEDQLQSGDIIGIVGRDGSSYGTSHVGIAIRKDGVLCFMHASAPFNYGKVVIECRLSDYLAKYRSHAGIIVGRPLK
ncbi:MAG: N-acetylmuramoyl-L-alanine amidase-like domain-containing protein [Chthoniobacteraceae bacterium]